MQAPAFALDLKLRPIERIARGRCPLQRWPPGTGYGLVNADFQVKMAATACNLKLAQDRAGAQARPALPTAVARDSWWLTGRTMRPQLHPDKQQPTQAQLGPKRRNGPFCVEIVPTPAIFPTRRLSPFLTQKRAATRRRPQPSSNYETLSLRRSITSDRAKRARNVSFTRFQTAGRGFDYL
ncbi:MAG: hypothetical protein R2867_16185 [Caldilineaceae bacterium]